jgi:hypothetical protein
MDIGRINSVKDHEFAERKRKRQSEHRESADAEKFN